MFQCLFTMFTIKVRDGEPKYPPEWTGGTRVAGKYVMIEGGHTLRIATGWEDALEFPREPEEGNPPEITCHDFQPLDRKTGPVTPHELWKSSVPFVILGDYVVPSNYKNKNKPAPPKQTVSEDDDEEDAAKTPPQRKRSTRQSPTKEKTSPKPLQLKQAPVGKRGGKGGRARGKK